MSNVDFAWLRMDHPTNLMMINGVLVFDEPLPFDRLLEVMAGRLATIPRFRRRVVRGGRPQWEDDPDFDLARHVFEAELPEPGGDAELAAEISRLMSTPLDPDRPLWSFHLLQNYRGGSVLFGRLHHCIGDGIALMLVLLSLTDAEIGAAGDGDGNPLVSLFRPGEFDLAAVRAQTERLLPDAMKLMLHPVDALRSANRWLVRASATGSFGKLALARNDPHTVFKGRLGVAKRAAWSEAVPLADVKAVQAGFGGTINDVLLTAVTGGIRRYLGGRGSRLTGRLDFRAAVPVNLRPLERMVDLGNEFGLVFLPLPVGIEDPESRLAELRRRMQILKRSTESVMVLSALRILGMSPAAIQRLVVHVLGGKATAVMTNVPGPRETLYLGGRAIRDIFFWVPQAAKLGLGISICTYRGRARLGIASDVGLVPDPERLVDGFHAEFEAMHTRASRSA